MKTIRRNTIIMICSFFMMNIFSVFGIQKKTVYVATGCAAALSAVVSYNAWPLVKSELHPAVFGAGSAFMTSAVYCYLYAFTPEGRLKKAQRMINELMQHRLLRTTFTNDKASFDAVHDAYLTHDLPLISAYNHLVILLSTVQNIFGLINKASKEVCNNEQLQENCALSFARAKVVFTNISDAIKRIRAHKDYLPQLQIYKEFLANDKQAVAQEHMAYAQMQMASVATKQSSLSKKITNFFTCY